ncbi:MAG: hypothetical protein WCW16_03085 [Candidatus Magasanikbacteria bacterium]
MLQPLGWVLEDGSQETDPDPGRCLVVDVIFGYRESSKRNFFVFILGTKLYPQLTFCTLELANVTGANHGLGEETRRKSPYFSL